MRCKTLSVLFMSFMSSVSVFANEKDGVPVLPDEPTEAQMQLVRDGAQNECQQGDDDVRAQCVADYYVQHNLDEEPEC